MKFLKSDGSYGSPSIKNKSIRSLSVITMSLEEEINNVIDGFNEEFELYEKIIKILTNNIDNPTNDIYLFLQTFDKEYFKQSEINIFVSSDNIKKIIECDSYSELIEFNAPYKFPYLFSLSNENYNLNVCNKRIIVRDTNNNSKLWLIYHNDKNDDTGKNILHSYYKNNITKEIINPFLKNYYLFDEIYKNIIQTYYNNSWYEIIFKSPFEIEKESMLYSENDTYDIINTNELRNIIKICVNDYDIKFVDKLKQFLDLVIRGELYKHGLDKCIDVNTKKCIIKNLKTYGVSHIFNLKNITEDIKKKISDIFTNTNKCKIKNNINTTNDIKTDKLFDIRKQKQTYDYLFCIFDEHFSIKQKEYIWDDVISEWNKLYEIYDLQEIVYTCRISNIPVKTWTVNFKKNFQNYEFKKNYDLNGDYIIIPNIYDNLKYNKECLPISIIDKIDNDNYIISFGIEYDYEIINTFLLFVKNAFI